MASIKVSGVVIEEILFRSKIENLEAPENESFRKSVEYIHYLFPGLDVSTILPMRPKFKVDFSISNTCSGFANGIRKCILDELPIYSMSMDGTALKTNDPYVISDVLQKNINLIPIVQDGFPLEDMMNWSFTLDVINSTDSAMTVKSGDIKISDKVRTIPTEHVMSPNIPIMDIHPATFLKITHITIVVGASKDDAAKFATVSNTRYLIDPKMTPLAHSIDDEPGCSSMMKDPDTFTLGYTTYRNVVDPRIIVFRCCDSFAARLGGFSRELDEVKESDALAYFSGILDIETKGDYKVFNFKNESWTLVNMIAQYCYRLDPSISFVAPSIVHPSTSVGVVKIKHPSPLQIIKDAIANITADVEVLRAAF